MTVGNVNKKTMTEQVEDVLSRGLQGENIDAMLASLSPYGRKIWEDMLTQFRASGSSEILEQLKVADYIEKPPTINQFIEDPYYLGTLMVKSQDTEGMFPAWKDILVQDFNYDSAIHNCVITGSLGIGKTFIMVTVLLYRILIATLLRNPHNFFGLTKGTKIIFNLLSVTKSAVTETAFGDAMNFMANSPYFLEECRYNPDLQYTGFRIPLKGALMLTAGSRGQHILGRNIIGVGLDEGNWRLEAEPDTKAYELYNEVRNRINNRFRKVAGYLPAISILASSAKDESSFTETIIREIEKANDPATQKVYRNSVYKIKRHTLQLGPKWFKVAYGLKNIPPMILSGWYSEDGHPIGEVTHEDPSSGASVELVPKMYYEEFKRRPLNALRDVCGISTGGVNRWFGSMVDFERCVEMAIKDGIENPVKGGTELLSLSTEDSTQLWDYLDHRRFLTRVQSQIIPKRHPGQLRYAHIDLATQTMAGVAICHLVGSQLVENLVKDGVPFSEYRLIVEYDFILTVIAGQVKPISLEKIQNFILWLRSKCGFNFGKVTFDQWQSEMSLQMLEAQGFNVDKQSIDRNKDAYTNWRMAIEELRLRPYTHRHMMLEAENLLDTEKKVDHPPNGSKDTTDACLSKSTEVMTLDGRTVELGQLTAGTRCWVYSLEKGRIRAGLATALGITRRNAKLLRIKLDNNKSVIATPDHLFMLRDGSYVRADSLKTGQPLMPFYFRRDAKGYGTVFNPATSRYEKVYNLIDRQFHGYRPKGFAVHHVDLTKHNDAPDNLERISNPAHWALHHKIKGPISLETEHRRQIALSAYNTKPETKKAAAQRAAYARRFSKNRHSQGVSALPRLLSLKYRQKHSSFMRKRMADPTVNEQQTRAMLARKRMQFDAVPTDEIVHLRNAGLTNKSIAAQFKVSESTIERRAHLARQSGQAIVVNYRRRFPTENLNHKVIATEEVESDDTTCLRVTVFENFALAAGVFVHNCAGAYNNAINSEEKASMLAPNNPRLMGNRDLEGGIITEQPLIQINLPPGYERIKTFKV